MAGALALMLGRGSEAPVQDPLMPFFVDAGTFTFGLNALSVPPPSNYADGDVFVMLVNSANRTIATPSGWTEVTNSPQGFGTAGAASATRLAVFYKVVSGPQSNVSVADTGSYAVAQIANFRRVNNTTPIDVTAGGTRTGPNNAGAYSLPSVTTTSVNDLILLCIGMDKDANSTDNVSRYTNSNLANIAELIDRTVSSGAGGGIALATGEKASIGSTGTTSADQSSAPLAAFITVALEGSTDYNSVTRITGAYGSAFSETYGSSQATAGVTLKADGTITTVSGESANPAWVNLPASGVGSSYWVRATGTPTGTGLNGGTTGVWRAMTSDRTWFVEAFVGTQSETWNLTFEFATDSAGTTIVGRSAFSLFAQSNSGPEP